MSRLGWRNLAKAAAASVIAASVASNAIGQDADLGPLTELFEGYTEPWQLSLSDAGYLMENTSDPASIRYVWATSPDATLGSRTITARVDLLKPDNTSNAGILYAFREEDDGSTFYYMFMLRPDDQITLYRRDVDGVETITSAVTDAVRRGVNELTITEDGDQITLWVNGERVALLGGIRGMGSGRIGIVAWGTGEYLFSGFSQSAAPPRKAPPEAPTPAKD